MEIIRSAYDALRFFSRPDRIRLIVIACISIVSSGLDFLAIMLLVPLLDSVGNGAGIATRSSLLERLLGDVTSPKRIVELTLLACACFVLKSVIAVVLMWWQAGVLNRAAVQVASLLMRSYCRLPWVMQQEITSGEVVRTVMSSVPQAVIQVNASVLTIITNASVLLSVTVALLLLDPRMAVLALAYLGFIGFIYVLLVRNPLRRHGNTIQLELQAMSSNLIEIVGGIRETTVRGTSWRYIETYRGSLMRTFQAGRVIEVASNGVRYLFEALLMVGVALIVVGALLAGSLEGAVASIGLLLAAGFRVIPALSAVISVTSQIRSSTAAIDVVSGGLEWEAQCVANDVADSENRQVVEGNLELRDVSFTFPTRETPALNHVSLDVKAGDSIGIVGSSGSGKTTLANVILGLLDPQSGSILVDGVRLQERRSAWRKSIGYVPQDVFLLDASVSQNVALGVELEPQSLHADRLAAAISLAHLDEVVAVLPEGLDTRIGEKGVQLSGGQKQRIGLARAFFIDPKVMILDEATSALDNESESIIEAAVAEQRGVRTMLIIAHRLSTVQNCDRIVFMKEGSVAAIGSFQTLLDTVPEFSNFVQHGLLEPN